MTLYSLVFEDNRECIHFPKNRRLRSWVKITVKWLGYVGVALGVMSQAGRIITTAAVNSAAAKAIAKAATEAANLHADAVKDQLDIQFKAVDKRIDDTNAELRDTNKRLDVLIPLMTESVGRVRYIHGIIKGETPTDYDPLPRKGAKP